MTITFITVTKKRFSSSSCIAPLIDPIAQHSCKNNTYISRQLGIISKANKMIY